MEGNDAVLEASLLTFLDEFYASRAPPDAAEFPEEASATVRSPKMRRDTNRARNNAVRELLALKTALPALENELQVRKSAKRLRFVDGNRSDGDATASGRVWRETAASQLRQRVRAEDENRRLRAKVEEARAVLWSLRGRLRGRATSEAVKQFGGESCWSAADLPPFDMKVKAVIEDLSRHIDAIFAALGEDFHDVLQVSVLGTPTVIECGGDKRLVLKRLLPFSVGETADATWKILTGDIRLHATSLFSFRSTESENDSVSTVIEYFGMKLTHEDASAEFRVTQVMRRFAGASREVIIWESIVEPVAINDCKVKGASFREIGHAFTRPFDQDESAAVSTSPYSVSEIAYAIETPSVSNFSNANEVSGFMLRTMALNLSYRNLQIDNLLLSSSFRNSTVCA